MSTMLKKVTLGATAMLLTASALVGGAMTLGAYPLSGSGTPERKGIIDKPVAGEVPKQALGEAQAAPQKAERDLEVDYRKSIDNLKRIGLAMHNYVGDFGHFPPAAIMSKNKKALLSWRVAILQYVNEGALFKEFKLDEPWDSTHNKKLLARMPSLYAPPGIKTPEPHTTFYQVFVGPGSIFEGPEGCRIQDVPDGTSSTVLVVEAGAAVPWTKPQELPYQRDKDLPKLGGIFDGEFYALVADASVLRVRRNPDPKQMHRFIQRNDGNLLDVSGLVREQP